MLATPYEPTNQAKSNRGHELAKRVLYPMLFGVPSSSIEYQRTAATAPGILGHLDGTFAVDALAYVNYGGRQPFMFGIQERFREPIYDQYQDVTVTEFNNNSGLPSELYKMIAQYFVYGILDNTTQPKRFLRVHVVDAARMRLYRGKGMLHNINGNVNWKNQDFEAYKLSQLRDLGLIELEFNGTGWVKYQPTRLN